MPEALTHANAQLIRISQHSSSVAASCVHCWQFAGGIGIEFERLCFACSAVNTLRPERRIRHA